MTASLWNGATLLVKVEGVDVSCDVTHITVNRGRIRLWDPMDAATATVVVNCGPGAQPHSRGPIGASMVIDVSFGAVTRHLYTGQVQLRQAETTTRGTVLTLDCVDGFETLSRVNKVADTLGLAVGAGETITARLTRWLDVAGWTAARSLSATFDTCPETKIDGNALLELKRTTLADGGDFYIDGDGTATFRSWAWRVAGQPVAATFSDKFDFDWVPYTAASLRDDLDEIQNHVEGTRRVWDTTGTDPAPVTMIATNPSSISTYGHRGDASYTDLELQTNAQVEARVGKAVAAGAQSSSRFDPIVLQPVLKPARIWPRLLRINFGSLIAANRFWPDGTVTALWGHVIGERWQLDANDATITLRISGTQTWDALGLGPPHGLDGLRFDPRTGKYCLPRGFPCPPPGTTLIFYAADHVTILGTAPADGLCTPCEDGGGVFVPDGTAFIGLDNGSGTIISVPITDARLKAVLWFTVLDPDGYELFEAIDHEVVEPGSGFSDITPSVIPGGHAINATSEGGLIGAQVSDHLHTSAVHTGWTVEFQYLLAADLGDTIDVLLIDLGTIVVRLFGSFVLGVLVTQLELGVFGVDSAHPTDPPALQFTGPLTALDVGAFHGYSISWDSASNLLNLYVDGTAMI